MQINQANQDKHLLGKAVSCIEKSQAIAMLTLLNIEGNAPYPVGSQMLVNEQGESWGQITAGCAEKAFLCEAQKAIKQGQNQLQRYGLDSPFFDIKLPCGSGVDIYFDVTSGLSCYQKLIDSLHQRQATNLTLETSLGLFNKQYLPTERMIIVGQSEIQVHLAKLAMQVGFEVLCLTTDGNGSVDGVVKSTVFNQRNLSAISDCDQYTAVVSLFHEHDLELPLLSEAVNSKAFFVGALGSRATHKTRLVNLQEQGIDKTALQRIYGPVGLPIGAVTPAQIAVSILAQIISLLPAEQSGI